MNFRLIPVLVILNTFSLTWAQNGEDTDILAKGEGIQISKEEVEQRARARLEELDLERLRFEAELKRKNHSAIESSLNALIADRVLSIEAEQNGISKTELVSQIRSSATEPTPEEIEQFWEKNKSRIKGEKEQVLPQISNYLSRQNSQKVYEEKIAELSEKYGIESSLPPLRFDVSEGEGPSMGPGDAPVTVIEFSDFECPYCSNVAPHLKKLAEAYGDRVRLVFRQFPLTSIHKKAQKAAEASLCANDQDMFWPLHDWMFENQKSLSVEEIKAAASALGIESEAFNQCIDSGTYESRITSDIRGGMTVGVTGTPAFFVNGRPLKGAVSYEALSTAVSEELGTAED